LADDTDYSRRILRCVPVAVLVFSTSY